MLQNFTTTQTLAALLGLYFVSAGIGLLVDRKGVAAMFNEILESPMLGYLGGVLAFGFGGVIIAIHNDWSSPMAGFVSFIGWIGLAEGVLMLAFRKWFLGLFARVGASSGMAGIFGAGTLILGVALLAAIFD